MRSAALAVLSVLFFTASLRAQSSTSAPPTSAPSGAMPYVHVDVKKKQIRVDCQALNVDIPLEFFCVTAGGNEHESVLRTPARPSHIHLALLMLGLQPGEPVKFSEAAQKWFPPHGPPLHISVEYQKDGHTVSFPGNELMRSVKTKKPMPPLTWIFAGSRILDDGTYGADPTGYVVSICNFDLCLIDVPELVSSANETLEWERNPDTVPPTGTAVTMIIEPAGEVDLPATPPAPDGVMGADEPATTAQAAPLSTVIKVSADNKIDVDGRPVAIDALPAQLQKLKAGGPISARLAVESGTDVDFTRKVTDALGAADISYETAALPASDHLSNVTIDQTKIDRLRQRWNEAVRPHGAALREAAQAQYEVLTELRREQQRLIDEADRVQRTIDEFEKEYQDMTTPQPEAVEPTTQP
jgi:biopolymer transport protein ExbD